MENSATSKVIDEGTIHFHSHDRCITTLQGIRQVTEPIYNLLEPYIEKGSISILKVIL